MLGVRDGVGVVLRRAIRRLVLWAVPELAETQVFYVVGGVAVETPRAVERSLERITRVYGEGN